jgi:hypothetical protein
LIIAGALVLAEVAAGITEASMTRKPSSPCTRDPSSDANPSCTLVEAATIDGL